MPEPIVVGYIRRAHGIRGAVILRPLSDDPHRFEIGSEFLTDDPAVDRLELTGVQPHKEGLLVTLAGTADRSAAERLRGVSLLVEAKQRRDLEDDEYWPEDLIGLAVHDSAGSRVGVVADVVGGASQDRLRVAAAQVEFEVPFVAAIVTDIDIAAGTLIVDLPEGLVDLER
jgi:16S rRNA processing protein RimM